MEDRIEQRITIRSDQDKVWQLVTRPGWWLPGSKTEPARNPVRLPVEYGGDSRPYVIDVVRVEPQGYVSFRWASAFGGAAPVPGNATLVEFYLRTVGDEVGVTVVESGFASLNLSDAQHLAVLEECALVSRRRAGRQVLFSVKPDGLTATADWLRERATAWLAQ
jgi:uncharacterized protein YndB with AHSA1/START domain